MKYKIILCIYGWQVRLLIFRFWGGAKTGSIESTRGLKRARRNCGKSWIPCGAACCMGLAR
jgi:hypothetical protein